jgi:spore coat protein H
MMKWSKLAGAAALAGVIILSTAGCSRPVETTPAGVTDNTHQDGTAPASPAEEKITRPAGWTDKTHGKKADPNYAVVFPQDRVNRIKITIASADWEAMQADMVKLMGPSGTGQPGKLPAFGGQPAAPVKPGAGAAVPKIDMTPVNPMWVPATIEFNGLAWTNVGVRYKGNSSLTSAWYGGSPRLPLKLDFDQFEDEYPGIDDQRFYGFKQLSLSNSFNDRTFLRDALAADVLTGVGLAAAQTGWCEVVVDHGDGEVNLGIYVLIEVVDDTVTDRVFGSDSGNIYEGEGIGASLAVGTGNRIQEGFVKENNETEADWSDVEALFNVLHSPERTAAPAAWRKSLESIFDADAFLEWLAVSAVLQHWDTYGAGAHNYYVYHDPATGLLEWISWDHNGILNTGEAVGPAGMKRTVTLGKEDIGPNWPLIRFLMDDPVYHERYNGFLEETINSVFIPAKLEKKCRAWAELIAPYAAAVPGQPSVEAAFQALINKINTQYQSVVAYLAAGG